MRATDVTTARFNLRPAVEITRGGFRCTRSTAAIVITAAFTVGFALAMFAVTTFGQALVASLP